MEVMFKDVVIRCETPPEKAAATDAARFAPMFNGKDLTGWNTTGNWIVEEGGVVALHPRAGETGWTRYDAYLTTARKYKNFILDLEFKINKGGNSGVFLRVGDPNSQVRSGFEVQILDTHDKPEPVGEHDCGGVIGTAALINPADLDSDFNAVHLPVMLGFAVAFYVMTYNTRNEIRVGRLGGAALLAGFLIYQGYLAAQYI